MTYSSFITIPFIIIIAIFLTLTIGSFWLSVYYLIKHRKKIGVLYLVFIVLIFLFALLNIYLFVIKYPLIAFLFQTIIIFPVIYTYSSLLSKCKLPESIYRIKISVAFLASIILLMQPIAYISYLTLADNVYPVRLERAKNKFRYIINYEKETLVSKIEKIKKDQKLIDLISQKDTEAIQEYIDNKKKLEKIDIFAIRIPNHTVMDGTMSRVNHISVLGTSSLSSIVKLESVKAEPYNFVIRSYSYDREGNNIGEITIGTTLNNEYFDALKPYFLSNFLVVNSHGVYYKSNNIISLPYSFNIYDLELSHNQIRESQIVPNLILSLPLDDQNPSGGSIFFETTIPDFIVLVKPVAVAQLILALNIIVIFLVLDRKRKPTN